MIGGDGRGDAVVISGGNFRGEGDIPRLAGGDGIDDRFGAGGLIIEMQLHTNARSVFLAPVGHFNLERMHHANGWNVAAHL